MSGAGDTAMKPLDAWPLQERQGIVGVLTDIDDTLTTDGAMPWARSRRCARRGCR
jgi:hypothetical protein